MTPGRKPSSRTSARCTSARTTARSSACLRSSAIERLPRSSREVAPRRRISPPRAPRRSIRTTSAPRSASSMPQNGPGPSPANSTTRTPCSGPTATPPLPRVTPVRPCCPHGAVRRATAGRRGRGRGLSARGARRCAGRARSVGRGRRPALVPGRMAVGDPAGQPHRLPADRCAAGALRLVALAAAVPGDRRARGLHHVLRVRGGGGAAGRGRRGGDGGGLHRGLGGRGGAGRGRGPPAGPGGAARRGDRRRGTARGRGRLVTPLLVVAGALVGAPLRLLADRIAIARWGAGSVLGTPAVNVTGSAVLGVLLGLRDVSPAV